MSPATSKTAAVGSGHRHIVHKWPIFIMLSITGNIFSSDSTVSGSVEYFHADLIYRGYMFFLSDI